MAEIPPITRIYRACDPVESVGPSDPRWVDLDAARGNFGVVGNISRCLRLADPDKSDISLLSGHIGVGKTSALMQLVETLRAPQPAPFLVVFANEQAQQIRAQSDAAFAELRRQGVQI
jgi:hypothetical protein